MTESIGRVYTNGDHPDFPISKALDDNPDTYWQAEDDEDNAFRPTMCVDFNQPTLVYDVKSKKCGNDRTYFGYLNQILIYTALKDDEPLTAKMMFQGTPMDPHLQLDLPEPINCTKIKFKFYYIANIENGGKIAQVDGLHFIMKRPYEVKDFEKAEGNYANAEYLKLFSVQQYDATITTNCDDTSHPITDAFDENMDTYWQAREEESDTLHPTIYVNFNKPTLFDALVYAFGIKSSKNGNDRTYFGYPSQILIYTALEDDEPLTPKVSFQGSPMDTHLQFIMSEPINCTKMKFEFYYVANIENGGKLALFGEFSMPIQSVSDPLSGIYVDSAYVNFHNYPQDKFELSRNGQKVDHPISDALTDDLSKYWVANKDISSDFKPSIYANFTEPVLLEGLIMQDFQCVSTSTLQ